MSNWVDVKRVDDFGAGEHQLLHLDLLDIAVFRLQSGFYAIEDRCSHDGGELASGVCEGDQIICPRHGARFCLRDGAALTPPAYEAIDTFPVRIHEGMVQVDIDG